MVTGDSWTCHYRSTGRRIAAVRDCPGYPQPQKSKKMRRQQNFTASSSSRSSSSHRPLAAALTIRSARARPTMRKARNSPGVLTTGSSRARPYSAPGIADRSEGLRGSWTNFLRRFSSQALAIARYPASIPFTTRWPCRNPCGRRDAPSAQPSPCHVLHAGGTGVLDRGRDRLLGLGLGELLRQESLDDLDFGASWSASSLRPPCS